MKGPDERAFEADLKDGPFLIGAAKSRWGIVDSSVLPEGLVWPQVVLWIAAASRKDAPDRYCLQLDLDNYPSVPPTGMFWDSTTREIRHRGPLMSEVLLRGPATRRPWRRRH